MFLGILMNVCVCVLCVRWQFHLYHVGQSEGFHSGGTDVIGDEDDQQRDDQRHDDTQTVQQVAEPPCPIGLQ